MSKLVTILNRYKFEKLRPGENDKDFKFDGPGLVLLCEEQGPSHTAMGATNYTILKAMSAKNDALEVARSALKQPRDSDRYRFAMLARIDNQQERSAVAAEIEALCTSGT